MTDNEIIKALEYCADASYCCNCAFDDEGESVSECTSKLTEAALDLIQRQQEEIEILKQRRANMFEILEAVERVRAKVIQELTEKIVEQLERRAYETADWMCGGTMKAVELTDAIEIVKGVQNERQTN